MNRWITIVGIGEDGMEGLGTRAREVIAGAEILIGGERHLALVPEGAAARSEATPLAASLYLHRSAVSLRIPRPGRQDDRGLRGLV